MRDDESILTWHDLTLAYIFCHAACCASAASSGRSLHLITSRLRTKWSLDCPNHVRRTKSSTKKRIIVRRSVRSMFGEQTFAQLSQMQVKSLRGCWSFFNLWFWAAVVTLATCLVWEGSFRKLTFARALCSGLSGENALYHFSSLLGPNETGSVIPKFPWVAG